MTPPAGAYDLVDAYDATTNRWSPLAKAPVGLHAQGGAVVGDTAYFIGGSTSCGSDKPSLSVYSFRELDGSPYTNFKTGVAGGQR